MMYIIDIGLLRAKTADLHSQENPRPFSHERGGVLIQDYSGVVCDIL